MRLFPSVPNAVSDLVPLFKRELELCRLQPGEVLLLFTDTYFNPAYPAAFMAAGLDLGAEVIQMTVPNTTPRLSSKTVVEAWKRADMVIGMCTDVAWLYTDAHNEALEGGTRTLMVEEPVEVLRRLFPDPDVIRRTKAGAQVMANGSKLRVTSPGGTDLTMSKAGRRGIGQVGVADVPGRWDHWPSGLVGTAPVEGSVEGQLVINTGDILLNLGRYVASPIYVTIREGRAVKFEGGLDALLLEEYFRAANEVNAYVVSHIGWGTDHRAQWNAIGTKFWKWGGIMDAESYYGNMQIAFGSNFARMLSGKNHCAFHIDIPCRNHNFWVDGTQIVDEGRIVHSECK